MTVGELRRALDGIPNELEVVVRDAGHRRFPVDFVVESTFFEKCNLGHEHIVNRLTIQTGEP